MQSKSAFTCGWANGREPACQVECGRYTDLGQGEPAGVLAGQLLGNCPKNALTIAGPTHPQISVAGVAHLGVATFLLASDPGFLAAEQEFAATHPWFKVQRLEVGSHFPMFEARTKWPQRLRYLLLEPSNLD